MRECDLYQPVRVWLERQGYQVHVELFDCDVIGVRGDEIVCVELKLCLARGLVNQLSERCCWANYVYAAVPTQPRDTGLFRHYGYGVLQVLDGKVRERCKARPQPWCWHKARKYRFKKLRARVPAMPHEVAGLPSCHELKRQRQARLVTEGEEGKP